MASEATKEEQICKVPIEKKGDRQNEDSNISTRQKRISEVPPFWQRDPSRESIVGTEFLEDITNSNSIILEDNTQEPDRCKAFWAKSVSVDDYTVISGASSSIGEYIVWNCTVETTNVCYYPLKQVSATFLT